MVLIKSLRPIAGQEVEGGMGPRRFREWTQGNNIDGSGAERHRASHVEGHDQMSQGKFRLASWEDCPNERPKL